MKNAASRVYLRAKGAGAGCRVACRVPHRNHSSPQNSLFSSKNEQKSMNLVEMAPKGGKHYTYRSQVGVTFRDLSPPRSARPRHAQRERPNERERRNTTFPKSPPPPNIKKAHAAYCTCPIMSHIAPRNLRLTTAASPLFALRPTNLTQLLRSTHCDIWRGARAAFETSKAKQS